MLAAGVGAAAGGALCPAGGGSGGAADPGAGERAAVGGGPAGGLRGPARAGAGAGGAAAPVGDRAVRRVCAPGLSGSARRTLRTNLRFLARRVVPALAPADTPLPRERAKAPYSPAEIAGYLALADAQPTVPRRMRAAGLVCLGAGAGLTGADLRGVRGSDVACRSGGVVVDVRGARPRAVPVLARYHDILLASAQFAGSGLVTGGTSAVRKNITTPLTRSLAGGDRAAPAGGLPAADDLAGRLRRAAGPGHVHARGRDHLLPAARRPARHPGAGR